MTNNELVEKIIPATGIASVTLVGFINYGYPMESGNCFSMQTEDKEYKIVNFNYENLKHLLKEGVIEFPISILPIGDRVAMIADERVPDDYYSSKFCTTCTPKALLPMNQRLKQVLDIKAGVREEKESEWGTLISYNVKGGIRDFNKISVKVNEIKELRERQRNINSRNIEDITFLDDVGRTIEINQQLIEDWKLTGLNIMDFIDTDFYINGFDEKD